MACCTSAYSNLRDHGGGIFCIPLTGCINILTPTHKLSIYVPLGLTKPVLTRQSSLAYLRGNGVRTCNRSFGIGLACVAAALATLVQAGFGAPAAAADLGSTGAAYTPGAAPYTPLIEPFTQANHPFWTIDGIRVGVLDHALEDPQAKEGLRRTSKFSGAGFLAATGIASWTSSLRQGRTLARRSASARLTSFIGVLPGTRGCSAQPSWKRPLAVRSMTVP